MNISGTMRLSPLNSAQTIDLVMLVLIAVVFFILPVVTRRQGSFIERLEEQQERDRSVVGLYDVIASRFGRDSLLIIVVSILSINFAENAGEAQAMKRVEFLVLNTQPEMVVLQVYGDNMICAPFNRETKEVQTAFRVIKIAEDSKMVLNLEKVGPFRPVESKPNPTNVPTSVSTPIALPSISPTVSPTSELEVTPVPNTNSVESPRAGPSNNGMHPTANQRPSHR